MESYYKKIISWIIISVIVAGAFLFILPRFSGRKSITVLRPSVKEVLRASETYQIRWEEEKMSKVGILLVKGEDSSKETKWIARDIPARNKKYDWDIFVWEETGENYRIAVLEYPWQEGKEVGYSDFFSIVGPQFASCDQLSIEKEWPYLPSDFPGLRKIFITGTTFSGNLGGLEGADQKCRQEAEAKNLTGTWKAFLGSDTVFALERLELGGIFVQAEPAALLPEGKSCHRLLGKNFEKFLREGKDSLILETEKLEKNFSANLFNLWLGRISRESEKECLFIFREKPGADFSAGYSFTPSCQNWTTARDLVPGYPSLAGEEEKFPICYTPEGLRVEAVGLAGLSSGLTDEKTFTFSLAKPCDLRQRLLCLEQQDE